MPPEILQGPEALRTERAVHLALHVIRLGLHVLAHADAVLHQVLSSHLPYNFCPLANCILRLLCTTVLSYGHTTSHPPQPHANLDALTLYCWSGAVSPGARFCTTMASMTMTKWRSSSTWFFSRSTLQSDACASRLCSRHSIRELNDASHLKRTFPNAQRFPIVSRNSKKRGAEFTLMLIISSLSQIHFSISWLSS